MLGLVLLFCESRFGVASFCMEPLLSAPDLLRAFDFFCFLVALCDAVLLSTLEFAPLFPGAVWLPLVGGVVDV